MKPKKKKTPRELEEEDDPLGGFLELLGLEDEEEEEYVRRDSRRTSRDFIARVERRAIRGECYY